MFYIRDIFNIQRQYEIGAIRRNRRVDSISATQPIRSYAEVSSASEDAPDAHSQRNKPIEAYLAVLDDDTPRRRVMVAQDLMTKPVQTIKAKATIKEAWDFLLERRFRHVPVVNEKLQIIGILSDRDLLRRASSLAKKTDMEEAFTLDDCVEEIMANNVLIATVDTEIREIAKIMFEERIGCVPISDDIGNVIGIITRSDILRTILVKAPLELWS